MLGKKGGIHKRPFPTDPSHGRASVGRPTRTYLRQFYTYTGSSLKDLLKAMDCLVEWEERVREICASGATL